MDIGILGSGNIGSTIGRKWASAGHRIRFGVRDPERKANEAERELLELDTSFVPAGQAVKGSEVVLLAVPSQAVPSIAQKHGPALADKVVLDATNDFNVMPMGRVQELRSAAPSAQIFRAFNSLGWEVFADPFFNGARPDLFYCGPADRRSLSIVEGLIGEVGLRPIRLGGLDQREKLDHFTRIWAALASGQGHGRRTAFKMLS